MARIVRHEKNSPYEVAEGTELTFTHSRLHDEESRRSHEEGWNGALDKLERLFLATEQSSP